MRLLDRYLLRELFFWICLCLGGLLIVYVAFDLIGSLNRFQENHLSVSEVARLYVIKMPAILVFILPIVFLIALLNVVTTHARHNEFTAIRAAGISLWRICVPYLAVGFMLSVITFALNELYVPDSEMKQDEIVHHTTADRFVQNQLGFHNGRDDRSWLIGSYNTKTHVMTSPSVFWHEPAGNRHLQARRAERVEGVWTFYDVNVFTVAANASPEPFLKTNKLALPQFTETPRQFAAEAKFSDRLRKTSADFAEIPVAELWDYLEVHPDLPRNDRVRLNTQLQGRIAAPWACLVVVFIAIPFGAGSGRRNIFVGVASSIIICFIYFILLKLGLALGTGGLIPAWIAAWLPNAFFGITGFCLMLRVR
jgi:lipopolysaccharide export system permease protein